MLTFGQVSEHVNVQHYIHLICDTLIKISEISGLTASPCGEFLQTLLSEIECLQKSGMTLWQVLLLLTRDAGRVRYSGECDTGTCVILSDYVAFSGCNKVYPRYIQLSFHSLYLFRRLQQSSWLWKRRKGTLAESSDTKYSGFGDLLFPSGAGKSKLFWRI